MNRFDHFGLQVECIVTIGQFKKIGQIRFSGDVRVEILLADEFEWVQLVLLGIQRRFENELFIDEVYYLISTDQ